MDTVGNSQLDIPDSEACSHAESYDYNKVDNFLRNVARYLMSYGEVISDGDTWTGRAESAGRPLTSRRSVRAPASCSAG